LTHFFSIETLINVTNLFIYLFVYLFIYLLQDYIVQLKL